MNFVYKLLEKISNMVGVNPATFNGFLLGGVVVWVLLHYRAIDEAKKEAARKSDLAGAGEGEGVDANGVKTEGAAVTNATEAVQDAANQVQVTLLWNMAHEQRKKMDDENISLDHMVLALAQNPRFKEILSCADGLSEEEIKQAIKKSRIMYNRGEVKSELVEEVSTALSKYARDLTKLAQEGKLDPVIGRSDEIRRLINILSRRSKNNPVIIGESGVGKTALVDGLAHRIATGDVPDNLKDTSIMALDLGILMAGAMMPGEFEERMKVVLKELTEAGSKFVLFIDDIHSVSGPNAQQGGGIMDASILLKPLLSRGELRCIGATTQDKFRKFIEKDPGLERRFQQVPLEQPTATQTVSILRGLRSRYEKHHNVRIADAALVAAATLSDRYIADRFLPDKAIDLVDEAASRVKMEVALKPEVLDRVERRITDLESERKLLRRTAAMNKNDAEALSEMDSELEELRSRRLEMCSTFEDEMGHADTLGSLQDEVDRLNDEIEEEETSGQDTKNKAAHQKQIKRREELVRKIRDNQAAAKTRRLGHKAGHVAVLGSRGEVTEADVARIISNWTGIPLTKLVESELKKLLHLGDDLHKRLIGQEEAVEAVAESIQRSRAGMKDPNGPIASFLFLGPTGVGKTELAKALATYLFNSEENMIRLDMSEYMEKHAVSKLIGAPPGYVGFDEGGQLTEKVRHKPYCVILFDEVEKAHVDVFNLLLQILDDGRVTDSQGRMVSFKNAIIIMTSNLGSAEIYREAAALNSARLKGLVQLVDDMEAKDTGKSARVKEVVMEQVRKHFKPEFVNRIDEFIIFEPLRQDQIHRIVKLRIQGVAARLAEKKMKLVLQDSVITYLSVKGYDPMFGARPVKRVVQRELETSLAKSLLGGHFQEGDTIVVGLNEERNALVFHRVPPGGDMPEEVQYELAVAESSADAVDSSSTKSSTLEGGSGPKLPARKRGKQGAKDGTKSTVVPSQTRELKFDPVKGMSHLHAKGVDVSNDGAAARSDTSTLPTDTG